MSPGLWSPVPKGCWFSEEEVPFVPFPLCLVLKSRNGLVKRLESFVQSDLRKKCFVLFRSKIPMQDSKFFFKLRHALIDFSCRRPLLSVQISFNILHRLTCLISRPSVAVSAGGQPIRHLKHFSTRSALRLFLCDSVSLVPRSQSATSNHTSPSSEVPKQTLLHITTPTY